MSVREFKLINKTGAEFSLNDPGVAYLYDPVGLGWGYSTGYVDAGDALIPTDTVYQHPAPSGWILFGGYSNYDSFLAFIQVGGLTLAYRPLTEWYYLDVSVVIAKSEINHETGRLHCDIAFNGLSYWYKANKVYTAVGGTATLGALAMASYCKITIGGQAVNPVWTLYDSANNAVGSGKVNTTVDSGKDLVINSRPSMMDLAIYNGSDRESSAYVDSDFTTERFLQIPAGSGYYMTFSDDGGAMGVCTVEVYERV